MVQIPSGLPLNSINSTVATASSPRSWAVGAILSATVTGPTVDQLLPLRIGGLDATAQSGLTLQAGTRLQLEVISNSPTITLRVLSATSNAQNSPVSAAMRLALPRQAGLPPLLANLNWLASQNPQQLPAAMRELAVSSQQLLTQLSNPADLAKPSGLQKAVIDSGIFLESKLTSQNGTNLSFKGDLKAGFLRLQQLADTHSARLSQNSVASSGNKQPILQSLPNVLWLATQPQQQIPQKLQPLAQLASLLLGHLSNPQLSVTNRSVAIESSLYLESKLQSLGHKNLQSSTNLEPILAKLRSVIRLLNTSGSNTPSTLQPSVSNTSHGGEYSSVSTNSGTLQTVPGTTKSPLPNNSAPAPPQRGAAVHAQPVAAADLPMIANIGSQINHLRKQLEGALSRIQLHQLASLPAATDSTDRAWVLELPVRYNDDTQLMHISIDTDESGSNNNGSMQSTWTANLAFDLPDLGAVHARISLHGEQLSTIFWAPSATTAARFQSALPALNDRLATVGFKAPRVQALHGKPPRDISPQADSDQRLVDFST